MQSNSQKIPLSIITINKNNANGLERTIQSVINQTFKDFEYIIIDGASTDGSVEVIKKFADKIDYWVSEPDKGIYNAMNKGIEVAQGEYLLFLNSGDHLVNDTVLEEVFKLEFDEDIVYGDLLIDSSWVKKYPKKLTLKYFIKDSLPHPASFIKKRLLIEYSGYNENFKIISDWYFWIKTLILDTRTYTHLDKTICVFYTNGISSNNELIKKEKEIIFNSTLSRIYPDYQNCEQTEKQLSKIHNSRLIKLIIHFQKSKIYQIWKKFQ